MLEKPNLNKKINSNRILFFFFSYCILWCQNLIGSPIITSVSPTHGEITGGNNVTINGSGFSSTTNVYFGSRTAPVFTVINDNEIIVKTPKGVPGTVNVVIAADGQSSISTNDFYTYTSLGWQGIIAALNIDQIALFNTTTNTFDALIPMANTSLASVITPDGAFIYTANEILPGFSVIDAATNAIIATIPTSAGDGAFDIVVNPSGTRIYISNDLSGFVTVVDTTTNTVVTDIFVQPDIGPLSVTPDGSILYVSSFFSGEVIPINTSTNTLGTSITTGIFPGKVSITPNGQKAFIPVFFNDTVLVMDPATQAITNSILLPSGSGPYGSSLLPDGTKLYVVNISQNTLSVIDVASETLMTTISLPLLAANSSPHRRLPPSNAGSSPFWAAATPDSKTVYVISETNNLVIPIDTQTNTVGVPFDGVMSSFEDLVISPDPAPLAAFSTNIQAAGAITTFDASSSISPIGTIASYAWDFGDGTLVTTTTPIINHIYKIPGSYSVSLVVTNSAGTSTKKVFSSGFMSNYGSPIAFINHLIKTPQASPTNLRGKQVKNQFLTQTDYINALKWNPPVFGEMPAYYEIFRNSLKNQIGTISGKNPLIFIDHHRKKNAAYTYLVVAVSASGIRSAPATIRF